MRTRKSGDVDRASSTTPSETLLSAWVYIGLILLVTVIVLSIKVKLALARSGVSAQTIEADANFNKTSRSKILKTSLTTREIAVAPFPSKNNSTASEPDSATTENAKLSTNLEWVFGGKQQRGWNLYIPLIHRLLDTEAEVTGQDFAAALSRWQQSMKLAPSGILDDDTWSRMISAFQARRIKDRVSPPSDQLVMAPPEDFYDPSRGEEFRRVERQTYAAYKRLVAAAAADPSLRLATRRNGELAPNEKRLKIISAFRSQEYQEQLRQKSPTSGRAGLARQSPHLTGRTLDLYVGGEPVDTKDANRLLQTQTPVYRWLVKHADKFGFHPYFYEPWHWEYIPR
ncbi:MAG: D-alanyl-D-alanine carboxypeptidase family protein [Pyrinomonadaceae bacterium]|nr:D-alanyl-D-alanine carboxypeptidase family protein [Pyrinomonadaceae bacterium]